MLSIKSKVIMLIFSMVLIIPSIVYGVSEAGVIFMLIEPGSRPGGMAEAYVAQVDDGLAGYWNPGAMAFNRKTQVTGMHTNWFGEVDGLDDIYYEYLGWNQYFEDVSGNLGLHIIYLTYGEQERTDQDGNPLGTFSSYELAVAGSYAFQYSDKLGLGMNIKYILSDLAPEGQGQTESSVKGRGMTFAVDLGVKYKDLLIPRLDFGLNIQNIGPNITYVNEAQADPLPLNWRMGLSYRLLDSEYNKFTINSDMNKLLANDDFVLKRLVSAWTDDKRSEEWSSAIYNVGAEYTYMNLLSLRTGYINDSQGHINGMSYGIGLQTTISKQYSIYLDFAMQQGGELTDYNKTYSIGLKF